MICKGCGKVIKPGKSYSTQQNYKGELIGTWHNACINRYLNPIEDDNDDDL
jgi:hypothetical protein